MGLLDRFGPRKPRRGPARSAAEREKLEQLRFLRELRRTDPGLYRQMMLERLGLGRDEHDELEQLEKTVARLRRMGIIKSANELDSGGLIRDAVEALAMFAQVMKPGAQVPPFSAGAPVPAGHAVPQQEAPPVAAHQQGEMMDPVSAYLRSNLSGKTPEEAARWLDSLPYPQARALVQQLRAMPEGEVYGYLTRLADGRPELRGLADWLRSQGELWVVAVARCLKQGGAAMGI